MKTLTTVILIFVFSNAFSQTVDFDKTFLRAKQYYYHKNYEKAEQYLLKCYRIDSSNVDLLKILTQLSIQQKQWQRVSIFSSKLRQKLPLEASKYYTIEILSYFNLQDYEKAEKTLNKCLKQHKINTFDAQRCSHIANNIAFAKEAVKNPVPFLPENLGRMVNSQYAEYLPNLTQDGKYLIYTRMISRSRAFPSLQEDFYIAKNQNGQWLNSVPLSQTINTEKNEGAPSISADGTILYFAACNRSDCEGNCDIYYSYNRGNYWTTPKNLKAVNTKYWESQPNISSDGKTLYFVSNRPGGVGKKDLWAVNLLDNNTWGEPYNLGKAINTEYDEISPFIHFDNKTLYFSSDGWPGMGAKDIFVSRKTNDTSWSLPQNLGYPINSSETDNSFFVDASGKTAYFSSKREGGYGKEDIYKFTLYEAIRPQKVGYYRAVVVDAKTGQKINVSYEINNLKDNYSVHLRQSKNSNISESLLANQKYIISVFAEGYLYFSNYIDSILEDSLSLIEQKIELYPIRKGTQFELKNIEFDFDKSSLKKTSAKELNLFAEYLKLNPQISILIEGHTDTKGNKEYNMKLSQQRAEAVKAYLISQKISAKRLETKGLGSTQTLSEKQDERNRRVVVKIIDDNK